jgi:hypothetical protein
MTQRIDSLALAMSLFGMLACGADKATQKPNDGVLSLPAWNAGPQGQTRFALVGDNGTGDAGAIAVRNLVGSWTPDFVVTLGDNNYPSGSRDTIVQNVDALWGPWMAPGGEDGPNAFWPCTGNHDWHPTEGLLPYTDHFELPGNERYYVLQRPLVDLYCLSTDYREPDGILGDSIQAAWLRDSVAVSQAPWQIAFNHHPPFSSGTHGDDPGLAWPVSAWGIDAMWSGHDHDYERIHRDGRLFAVQGQGGASLRTMGFPTDGTQVAAAGVFGATLADVHPEWIRFSTISTDGIVLDMARIEPNIRVTTRPHIVGRHATWKLTSVRPDTGWWAADYADEEWEEGRGPFGPSTGDQTPLAAPTRQTTNYLRHTFEADLLNSRAPRLHVQGGDGYVIWLNGTEVLRNGLTEGLLGWATDGTGWGTAPQQIDLPDEALLDGVNQLAVVVMGERSTMASLALDLGADVGTPLMEALAPWQWHTGTAPQSDWRDPLATVDWDSGPAPLGWRNELNQTEIALQDEGPPAAWFRKSFVLEATEVPEALMLDIVRPDGVSVWLNGTEVWRAGLSRDVVGTSTYAPMPAALGWENRHVQTLIDAALLTTGNNVVAVQAHSASPWGDLVFELDLFGLPRDVQ